VQFARPSRSLRLSAGVLVACLWAVTCAVLAHPASAAPLELWVNKANPGCSDTLTREQVTQATPWCTVRAAASAARAGDTVRVMPGTYWGTVRPAASGSASAPIRYLAPLRGVTIDAAGAAVGLKVIGVSWVSFQGFAVTGAAGQGVYVDNSTDVTLTELIASGNGTHGIQVRGRSLTLSDSTITGNGMAGISELSGSEGNLYEGNTISGNGKDGNPYNGDGIQLNGAGATVRGNTISDNGDPGIYEHGIYASASSSGYVIESNTLRGNAASDIKAAGSNGIVRYNRLGDSRLGLVFSDNGQPVSAYYNLIVGEFQHAVFFTTGTSAAQARLWNNTIVQTGRLTSSGDASAVFINAATLADLRNDLICYTNPDNFGVALSVRDASNATFVSNTNWLCGADPQGRSLAFNGARMSLGAWRIATGQDSASLSSPPATFDADFRVSSENRGAGAGQALGLPRDYVGVTVPALAPDIGAYQSPAALAAGATQSNGPRLRNSSVAQVASSAAGTTSAVGTPSIW
jgi:Right handed beta helix region